MPILWILFAVVIALIELFSMTFILLWIAIAALLTGVLGFMVHIVEVQVAFFVVIAALLLFLTQPFSKRMRNRPSRYQTKVDEMIGQTAQVVEGWLPGEGGMVKIHGDVWSAREKDPVSSFVRGEFVLVEAVETTLLFVKKVIK